MIERKNKRNRTRWRYLISESVYQVRGPAIERDWEKGLGQKDALTRRFLQHTPRLGGVFTVDHPPWSWADVWFGGGRLTIETFLLERLEEAARQRIRLKFFRRVRLEKAFSGPEELKRQILCDVVRARAFFRRAMADRGAQPTPVRQR